MELAKEDAEFLLQQIADFSYLSILGVMLSLSQRLRAQICWADSVSNNLPKEIFNVFIDNVRELTREHGDRKAIHRPAHSSLLV